MDYTYIDITYSETSHNGHILIADLSFENEEILSTFRSENLRIVDIRFSLKFINIMKKLQKNTLK